MRQVAVKQDQLECLEAFSRLTQTSLEKCVQEALDDWIQVSVAAVVSQTDKSNLIMFPCPTEMIQ